MSRHAALAQGDKVIYSPRNSLGYLRPVVTTVQRVTNSGWPVIAERKRAFRPEQYHDERWSGGDSGELYVFTDARLAKLNKYANNREQAEKERQEEREREAQERADRIATQLAEARRVCGNVLPIQSRQLLPDGSRFILLDVPIHPERTEKQFDLLIVQIKDKKDYEFGSDDKVMRPAADSTYITAVRGFSGRSSLRATGNDTDDDLLWELVRGRYFDWA